MFIADGKDACGGKLVFNWPKGMSKDGLVRQLEAQLEEMVEASELTEDQT